MRSHELAGTFLERLIAENPELEALITPLVDPRDDWHDLGACGEQKCGAKL